MKSKRCQQLRPGFLKQITNAVHCVPDSAIATKPQIFSSSPFPIAGIAESRCRPKDDWSVRLVRSLTSSRVGGTNGQTALQNSMDRPRDTALSPSRSLAIDNRWRNLRLRTAEARWRNRVKPEAMVACKNQPSQRSSLLTRNAFMPRIFWASLNF